MNHGHVLNLLHVLLVYVPYVIPNNYMGYNYYIYICMH